MSKPDERKVMNQITTTDPEILLQIANKQFWMSIVESLAWPLVVLLMMIIYKQDIKLSVTSLQSLKFKELELNFNKLEQDLPNRLEESTKTDEFFEIQSCISHDAKRLLSAANQNVHDEPFKAVTQAQMAMEKQQQIYRSYPVNPERMELLKSGLNFQYMVENIDKNVRDAIKLSGDMVSNRWTWLWTKNKKTTMATRILAVAESYVRMMAEIQYRTEFLSIEEQEEYFKTAKTTAHDAT